MENNILLSKKKCLKIFDNYNFHYDKDIFNKNINSLFIELSKIPDINYKIIKNCIKNNENLDLDKSFLYILDNFKNKNNNILNNIETLKYYIKNNNKDLNDLLLFEINNKLQIYNNNKNIYSSLKLLIIIINKKDIDLLLKQIKLTNNMKRIIFYINKITNYIDKNKDLNVNSIIEAMESILYNKDIIKKNNIEPLISLINKCKNYGNIINNDLERILKKIDPNINNYIYFLNNKDNLFNEKEKINDFLININYQKKSFKEIDNLNLKRGFIQGLQRDDKNYLLKYQPNKSLMELVLNCYIKLLNETNFLIPLNFFINEDNSYFYIIEKYDTDLYKYFHLLESNNKIIKFNEIINITKFIMNSVDKLHKNNIIHSDLKPENIVLNLNKDLQIDTLKIIDFDVGLFNSIPSILIPVPKKYEKVLNNKKPRGTRIYMLKNEKMEFKNDIFAIGVILIVILYKNIKNLLSYKKKENNKKSLKIQNFIKKMNILKDTIDKKESKIKLLNLMEVILKKESSFGFFDENNFDNFLLYKKVILDCINTENLSIILEKINKL